jgi:TRAP-type C4-dicarboxylate transport system permease small subunit
MLAWLSYHWARVELTAAAILAAAISVLILLNVVTRSIGMAIFWVDELAIYVMVWMTFLAASAAVHYCDSVAVTLVRDKLSEKYSILLAKFVDVIVFAFALALIGFCWRWFMPFDLMRAGFDTQAFQGETFNFIYSETTRTLPFAKFWVWLVMWLFAGGMTLHSLNNLLTPSSHKRYSK